MEQTEKISPSTLMIGNLVLAHKRPLTFSGKNGPLAQNFSYVPSSLDPFVPFSVSPSMAIVLVIERRRSSGL